jgi:hypothetical protein
MAYVRAVTKALAPVTLRRGAHQLNVSRLSAVCTLQMQARTRVQPVRVAPLAGGIQESLISTVVVHGAAFDPVLEHWARLLVGVGSFVLSVLLTAPLAILFHFSFRGLFR